MFNDILYPTDGSDGSEAALETCRDLGETYDATVHVLHVAETLRPHGLSSDVVVTGSGGMVGDPEGGEGGMVSDRHDAVEVQAEVQRRATELVEDVASRLDAVTTRTAVRTGTPHEAILEYAAENDVDVVVMGTHGRTGLDRYLLGSVTEKTVRTADVPVLTVRGAGESVTHD
jgi:nucleotide-binding universal stress UspA family protein